MGFTLVCSLLFFVVVYDNKITNLESQADKLECEDHDDGVGVGRGHRQSQLNQFFSGLRICIQFLVLLLFLPALTPTNQPAISQFFPPPLPFIEIYSKLEFDSI